MKLSSTFAAFAMLAALASTAPTPFADNRFEVEVRDGDDHLKHIGPPKPKLGKHSFIANDDSPPVMSLDPAANEPRGQLSSIVKIQWRLAKAPYDLLKQEFSPKPKSQKEKTPPKPKSHAERRS
jgi:hypothetical protein